MSDAYPSSPTSPATAAATSAAPAGKDAALNLAAEEDEVESSWCAVCCDTVATEWNRLRLPRCHHIFCASCVLSWALVRATCPLCKSAFDSCWVRRELDGTIITHGGWRQEPLRLLMRATWVQMATLTSTVLSSPVTPAPPSLPSDAWAPPAGYGWAADEQEEEAREQAFWEQEAADAEHQEAVAAHAMRGRGVLTAGRVVGNRRFGAGGFIRSQRMVARAARQHRRGKRDG